MAKLLRPFFPTNPSYKAIRDTLIASRAIEDDHRYVVGSKAIGYRLGQELNGMRQHRVDVTDPTLARKIRQSRGDWIKAPTAVHAHLLHNLQRLRIDYPPALDWLLSQDDFEPAHETAAQMIRDQQWHFTVCDYGRVHTNVTNLRSGLRRFLTLDGKPLVNLDIRNSQPLIFGLILQRHYGPPRAMPDDARRYVELCQQGRFYDVLMAESGIPPDRRATFKRRFFGHVFFCRNLPETEAARLFGTAFPTVYAAVRQEKRRNYADLAKNLQRTESGLMIGGVVARLMREAPHVPLLTVHDSILTHAEHAEAVGSIMLQEFAKAGLAPTIRIEDLGGQS
jgi:hypothetical protein